jgi:hypothetical protein
LVFRTVTAPVAAETAKPSEAASEETPLLMEEVETHVGTPATSAKTKPFVPVPYRVEVAWDVGMTPFVTAPRTPALMVARPSEFDAPPEFSVVMDPVRPLPAVTVVVATPPRVVLPAICVMYESWETVRPVVVAMAFALFTVMLLLVPDKVMPSPAVKARTPVLLKEVPSYERPVPAVVVATQVGMPPTSARTLPFVPIPKKDEVAIAVGAAVPPVPFASTVPAAMFARLKDVPLYERPVPAVVVATPVHPRFVNASTCPGVPVKSEVVVVAMVRTEGEAPMTAIG